MCGCFFSVLAWYFTAPAPQSDAAWTVLFKLCPYLANCSFKTLLSVLFLHSQYEPVFMESFNSPHILVYKSLNGALISSYAVLKPQWGPHQYLAVVNLRCNFLCSHLITALIGDYFCITQVQTVSSLVFFTACSDESEDVIITATAPSQHHCVYCPTQNQWMLSNRGIIKASSPAPDLVALPRCVCFVCASGCALALLLINLVCMHASSCFCFLCVCEEGDSFCFSFFVLQALTNKERGLWLPW